MKAIKQYEKDHLTNDEKILLADWFLSKAEITFIDCEEYNICLDQEISWLKDEEEDRFNEVPKLIAKHQMKAIEDYYNNIIT